LDDATEAERLLTRALGIYQASYGPAHSKTVTGVKNLELARARLRD
jgi:hypothetical protein